MVKSIFRYRIYKKNKNFEIEKLKKYLLTYEQQTVKNEYSQQYRV